MLTDAGLPEPSDEIRQEPRWEFRLPDRWRLAARQRADERLERPLSRWPAGWRRAVVAAVLLAGVPGAAYWLHAHDARAALHPSSASGTSQVTGHQHASACSPSTGACSFRFP